MNAMQRLAVPLVVGLAIVLAGCMLIPGKFVSELDIRRNGQFSFSYSGEIHLLALSKLAQMGRGDSAVFVQQPCWRDSEEVNCSESEVKAQKSEWEESRKRVVASRAKDSEQMKAVLGGIDPADPKAAEEFAARLRRQAGWKRVEYKGDGLFDVDFVLSGTLTHDFAFPTMERMAMVSPFVQIALRNDGTVRVDAPGFGSFQGMEPWRMMQMATIAGQNKDTPGFPVMDGRFILRTDGAVLANNTEDGPQTITGGQTLVWSVNPRSQSAPMALLRLR